ncbi:hypothetical protein [Streptomyces sp. A5-4]|uniref:hypothetical protein n=1 Tax=Streptomyces sp. A5-4 TaxID=3384771 RepID=UPI003DA9984D
MEVLLAACLLAWAAGAQSEQAKLGISPAQRAAIREQTRHEKAVRKIAEKHGTTPPNPTGVSTWKEPPAAAAGPVTVPEAFRAGYRGHTPLARVATPMGRHAGNLTAKGVHWAKDTGRSAVREYRKRRKDAGKPDPAPVLIPPPPDRPPLVPPMPTTPPAAGSGKPAGVTLTKPAVPAEPEGVEKPPEGVAEPAAGDERATGAPEAPTAPEGPAGDPAPAHVPGPRAPDAGPEAGPETGPGTRPEPVRTGGAKPTMDAGEGVGRMAAEVSYDSVMDESDELSLMCGDDVQVYGRIRQRCEREIGRADDLIAQLENVGAGAGVIGWVARCREQYQVVHGQLDELERNTLSQAEAVVKAKALLEAGQGLYADIAQDMESVAERGFYTSDAVDGEDTAAHSEIYETKGA